LTKNKLLVTIGVVLLLVVLFIIFSSLKTSPRLSEEKFVEVYVQLSMALETFDADSGDLEQERKKVLDRYGVTQEEIDEFVMDYNQNPEKWAKVWERIVQKLEEKKQKAKSP
jgi:hypothetical protein